MQPLSVLPKWATAASLATLAAGVALAPSTADACGCFARPDPTVPLVQAGERIVFSHDGDEVVAHIQVQYEGAAQEFGWLVPTPTVPSVGVGTEELFAEIIRTTQPLYRVVERTDDSCLFSGRNNNNGAIAFGARDSANQSAPEAGKMSPLVYQASVGPYDYAVLKADDKTAMLDWLKENRYFIPTEDDQILGPYIRPGAFFLALKLRAGNDTGDIQPIVLRYKSDLPMIPLILTSVAANPEMGVQVWVLGKDRAIPRNYRHTVINDEYIDWFGAGQNYNDVVIGATNEAENGQSFVTEYAGDTLVMKDRLIPPSGRFGSRQNFEQITDATQYLSHIRSTGFYRLGQMPPALQAVLLKYFPMPASFAENQITTEGDFLMSFEYYNGERFRRENPQLFVGVEPYEFDPVELTKEIWERVVGPTEEANQLFFDNPYMTRLYTTLSPEEMTRDPVFSFNPDLPTYSNTHEAIRTFLCGPAQGGRDGTPSVLELPDGRRFYLEQSSDWMSRSKAGVPFSLRIENLREEGLPEIVVDNRPVVSPGETNAGCSHSLPSSSSGQHNYLYIIFGALSLGWFLRRKQ